MANKQDQLRNAIEENDLQAVRQALASGANINRMCSYAYTPLGWAVYKGRLEMIQHLLEYDVDIQAHACSGKTALQMAKDHGRDAIVSILEKAEIKQLAKKTPEWSLFSVTKLAHVEISPALGRRLTEIFNFESRERLLISENLHTHAETVLPPVSFDTLPDEAVEKALDKFSTLGGEANKDFVLRHIRRMPGKM